MGIVRTAGAGIVVAAALAASTPAPAAPDGTAVIAGQVVPQWNKMGSTAPNPNGIAGATVEVVAVTWPSSEFPPFDEKPGPVLATATTAADGTFRIERLPAGRFGVIVRSPKCATTTYEGFRVADGAVYRGFELVCDEAPHEFASKVVRKDGSPLGGLEVVAWKAGFDTNLVFARREVVCTTTAADGSFRLSGTVDHPNVAVRTGPASYVNLPVRRTWGEPSPPTLPVGGDATLDVVVTDEGGRPVSGARVRLLCGGLSEQRTSAEGRCTFAGVEPGGFVLVADAPGLAGAPVAGTGPALFGGERDPKHAPLVSGRNERKVALVKACTLTGTVVDRAGDAPVAGARVRFVTALSSLLTPPEATTDGAGRFTLRDLPPGGGAVVIDKEWWRQTEIYSNDVWDFVGNAARGEKRTGEVIQGATVCFPGAGAAVDGKFALDRYAPLSIELKDTSGKPVVGAMVSFIRKAEGGLSHQHADVFVPFLPLSSLVFADDRGRATADVDPGEFDLWVTAPGFPQWIESIEPAKSRPAGTRVVVLQRYAIADVRVVDAAGKPVAGAWMWRESSRRPGSNSSDGMPDAEYAALLREHEPAVADAGGKLRHEGWPGSVLVIAGRPGLLGTLVTRVNVSEGGPKTYDVKLAPVAAIEGRVAHGGKPREGARVRVIERLPPAPKDSYPRKPQFADIPVRADGTFRVDSMLTGGVALFAYVPTKDDPDYAELMSDVTELDVKAGAATVLPAALDLKEPK